MSDGLTASAIKLRAKAEGFDLVQIAQATRLERDVAGLQRWLQNDYHAGMDYMESGAAPRAELDQLVPGCRSVIMVALNYAGPEGPQRPQGWGRVARYARGRDYHRVMGKRLRRLAKWIDASGEHASRAFVDSAPVLERGWAERAGLGWIGKNTQLLRRDLGSWTLLGEILTTAALESDETAYGEFCGSCTACLDACPTDAFPSAGVLDANRCISYWTIEHRGSIPESMRPGLGDWIFGCDVCQEVCPWNERFGHETNDLLERRADLDALDPIEVVQLDEATFRERYSGTPLMRAKWTGMRRNACVLIGNRRHPEDVPILIRLLDDVDPIVVEHAAWALLRLGTQQARTAIIERCESVEALASIVERARAESA